MIDSYLTTYAREVTGSPPVHRARADKTLVDLTRGPVPGTPTAAQRGSGALLSPMIESGFDRVLSVAVARVGTRPSGRPGQRAMVLGRVGIAASVPAIIELALLLAGSDAALHSVTSVAWVVVLGVIDAIALAFGLHTWKLLSRAGPALDEMLSGCPDRDRLVSWLDGALSGRRQIGCSLFWAGVACVLLRLTEPAIESHLEMGLVSYLSVAWTGAIGGNCIYWIVALSELGRRVLRQRPLKVVWHSPASTPGLATLSDTFTALTLAVLLAFLVVEVLALRAIRYGHSEVLAILADSIPVATAVAALLAGILPHTWLYLAVRDARRWALAGLRNLTGEAPPADAGAIERIHTAVSLYRTVETSPGLPFNTAAMVQYGAAILGALLALLLG